MEKKLIMDEMTYYFADLAEANKEIVCEAHARALGTTGKKLLPIFDFGNPLIVVGQRRDGTIYFRVHADSVDLMKLLLTNNLK